jgi:hypothetical protein
MKQTFVSILVLVSLSSFGQSDPSVSEFRVSKNQSVAKVFKNLATAYKIEGRFQILVTPEVAEKEVTELVLRNIDFSRSVQLICERNKLSYLQKGNLFVITGSSESIAAFHEEVNDSPVSIQRQQNRPIEKNRISRMPVIGERPEFDMVWEMKKELEELRKRVATLEKNGANQTE